MPRYIEGSCIEVWTNGQRVGFIFEDWFYPVPGVQLSGEELTDIGTKMMGLSIIPVTTPELSIDDWKSQAATLRAEAERRRGAPANSLTDRVAESLADPHDRDRGARRRRGAPDARDPQSIIDECRRRDTK